MKKFFRTLIVALSLVGSATFANNVNVTSISLIDQNTAAGLNNPANHTFVKFNVTWDNSWRTSSGPGNWDAVWVFVKYQEFGQNYKHATLSTTSAHHTVLNDGGVAATITPSADGKGVFMYRSADGGPGSINWQDVKLRWNYRTDVVHDTANVTMQVFAIEMVYVPQGSFYVGDGNVNTLPSTNGFRKNNQPTLTPTGREAYLMASEGSFTLVNGNSTSLTGMFNPQWNTTKQANDAAFPAAFPKGFNAFYCQKYEVSQKQYVDFFNTLPTAPVANPQKGARNLQQTAASAVRNAFNWSTANLDDANLTKFGTAHSGDRAQNWMSWNDAFSYADWAALRPMTEFEFEKAARGRDVTYGPIYPINGEYAWGNTTLTAISGTLLNDGTMSEGVSSPTTSNSNCNYNNITIGTGSGNTQGPARCGIFAAKNRTPNQRMQSGASFYGVMEMSGNLSEWVMSIGSIENSGCYGRGGGNNFVSLNVFDGSHGDGTLDANGKYNVTNWLLWPAGGPSSGAVIAGITVGLKGGNYSSPNTELQVSNRNLWTGTYSGCTTSTTRNESYVNNAWSPTQRGGQLGFRPVRTAP